LYAEKARQESIKKDRLLELLMKRTITILTHDEVAELGILMKEYQEKQKNSN
jgi:hypothetical protein